MNRRGFVKAGLALVASIAIPFKALGRVRKYQEFYPESIHWYLAESQAKKVVHGLSVIETITHPDTDGEQVLVYEISDSFDPFKVQKVVSIGELGGLLSIDQCRAGLDDAVLSFVKMRNWRDLTDEQLMEIINNAPIPDGVFNA